MLLYELQIHDAASLLLTWASYKANQSKNLKTDPISINHFSNHSSPMQAEMHETEVSAKLMKFFDFMIENDRIYH